MQKVNDQLTAFSTLFEYMNDMVFLIAVEKGPCFKYVKMNHQAIKKTSLSEGIYGLTINEIMPKSCADYLNKNFTIVVNTKRSLTFEGPFPSSYNESFLGELNVSPILNEQGTCTHILAIVRDITSVIGSLNCENFKQINLERENGVTTINNQRLQSLFHYNPDIVCSFDLNGSFLSVNPAVENILGYTSEEMINKNMLNFIVSKDIKRTKEHFKQAINGKTPKSIEITLVHKNKSGVHCDITCFPIRLDQKIVGVYSIAKDISECKKLRESLVKSEEKYRLITENMSDLIRVIDEDGILKYASPSHEALLGYHPDEIEGQSMIDRIHPEDLPGTMAKFNELVHTKQPCSSEYRIKHAEGHYLYFEANGTPVVNTDGEIKHFMVVCRDITRRKEAEDGLRQMQRELKNTISRQQGMIMKIKKRGGKFVHLLCDGELLYRFGLTPDDVVEKDLFDFLPKETALYKKGFYSRAWKGEDVTYEGEFNGIIYIAQLKPVMENGRVIEIISSCIDITDRKHVENELLATKELLDSFVKNTAAAIDVVDLQGNVVRVNRAFEEVYQWKKEKVIGQPLPVIPNEFQEETMAIWKNVLQGNQLIDYEAIRQRRDGTQFEVSLTVSPIRNKKGEIVAISAISRDISNKKKDEEMMLRSEKLAVIGELAAGVAHEIRNPLTVVKGFIDLMNQPQSENQQFIEIVKIELTRIEHFLDEMLVLAKPVTTKRKSTDLCRVLLDTITLIESQASLRNIEMTTTIQSLPNILCDENKIKQVYLNILMNAIEAVSGDGGKIKIHTFVNEGECVVRIQDNGCGIPKERIKKLGEPFYSNKEKGTGLGLTISNKIIQEYKGHITFNSQIGEGTIVDIILPLSE